MSDEDLLSFDQSRREELELIARARAAAGVDGAKSGEELVGLALSGGGIRSATFCLGVLQALARIDPPVAGPVHPNTRPLQQQVGAALRRIDYLSTVSGGGYVGSWLSAWIHRKGLAEVAESLGKTVVARHEPPEAPEVTWLRRYSNYLAPRLGFLSADSMTLVATWLRNVLLNLLVLLTFLAALFIFPRLLLVPAIYSAESLRAELGMAAAWLAFFVVPLGISLHFSSYFMQDAGPSVSAMNTTGGVVLLVILPGALAALLGSLNLFYALRPAASDVLGIVAAAALMMAAGGAFWLVMNSGLPRIRSGIGLMKANQWRAAFAGFVSATRQKGALTWSDYFVFPIAYFVALLAGFVLVMCLVTTEWTVTGSRDLALRVELAASALAFGAPALLGVFGIMGSVVVGMVGRNYQERTREWWSRLNAWFIFTGVGWFALVFLSFYAAPLLSWAFMNMGGWYASLAGAAWFGSLLAALFAKPPPTTERTSAKIKSVALNIALLLVVAGLLLGVAGAVGFALEGWGRPPPNAQTVTKVPPQPVVLQVEKLPMSNGEAVIKLVPRDPTPFELSAHVKASFEAQDRLQRTCVGPRQQFAPQRPAPSEGGGANLLDCSWPHWPTWSQWAALGDMRLKELRNWPGWKGFVDWTADPAGVLFLLCAGMCVLFSYRVDVNKFSLHNMYKNRLIRCYLGASKGEARRAHPFTGFDERDDISLQHLSLAQGAGLPPVVPGHARIHTRPFHLINGALNITQGSNLAWQERKAASFTFSPLHCGFTLGKSIGDAEGARAMSPEPYLVGGYRRSGHWASEREERRRFSLGMAIATSGAAFSSLRGAGSTPATSFLATVFNIRLGRWSPNPLARKDWKKASPAFGLYYLFQELFGYSSETSNFVYLSDGGHFDNTGIYELVRRECKTIVAVDATADYARGYEDLANVVRKCRIDFGVKIHLDIDRLGTVHEPPLDQRRAGFDIGEIEYGGGAPRGKLIFIKPTRLSLEGLGVDLYSYGQKSGTFPHQTTIDQFFSESQFESYRALGERIAGNCLADPRARFW